MARQSAKKSDYDRVFEFGLRLGIADFRALGDFPPNPRSLGELVPQTPRKGGSHRDANKKRFGS
jgi:hypothetical protein